MDMSGGDMYFVEGVFSDSEAEAEHVCSVHILFGDVLHASGGMRYGEFWLKYKIGNSVGVDIELGHGVGANMSHVLALCFRTAS
jgi:hypothetical protein